MSPEKLPGGRDAVDEEGDVVFVEDVPSLANEELLPQEEVDLDTRLDAEAELYQEVEPEVEVAPVDAYQEYWEIYDSLSDNYSSEAAKKSEADDQARKRGVAIPPAPGNYPLAS